MVASAYDYAVYISSAGLSLNIVGVYILISEVLTTHTSRILEKENLLRALLRTNKKWLSYLRRLDLDDLAKAQHEDWRLFEKRMRADIDPWLELNDKDEKKSIKSISFGAAFFLMGISLQLLAPKIAEVLM